MVYSRVMSRGPYLAMIGAVIGFFFGIAVIKADRIANWAEPGTIVASRVVADLCEGKEFSFEPLGAVVLKGFNTPTELHRITHR